MGEGAGNSLKGALCLDHPSFRNDAPETTSCGEETATFGEHRSALSDLLPGSHFPSPNDIADPMLTKEKKPVNAPRIILAAAPPGVHVAVISEAPLQEPPAPPPPQPPLRTQARPADPPASCAGTGKTKRKRADGQGETGEGSPPKRSTFPRFVLDLRTLPPSSEPSLKSPFPFC